MYYEDEARFQAKCARALRRDMVSHGLDIEGDLICDGKDHENVTYQNREHKMVCYTAFLTPFGPSGPAITAIYRTDDGQGYTFAWSPPRDKNNFL